MRPLLIAPGREDEFISKAAQAEIKAALPKNQNDSLQLSVRIMPSLAWWAHYTLRTAALAHERTYAFLNRQLR